MGTRSRAGIILGVIAMAMALVSVMAAPAVAGKGDKGGRESSSVTEDDDTNDGSTPNNVEDDGDDKHPSGKDRSVENGPGTQGSSSSDPDDDGRGPDRSNGGPDKPGGSGGEDLADQDGNNGCGNDDDFEDDNEGWCGAKPKKEKEDQVVGDVTRQCPEIEAMDDKEKCAAVGGGAVVSPTPSPVEGGLGGGPDEAEVLGDTIAGDEVLGERITKESDEVAAAGPAAAERFPGRVLPFTGAGLVALIGIAIGLIASGLIFRRSHRR